MHVSGIQIAIIINIGSPFQYFETLLNADQTRGQSDVKDENNTVSHDASAVHSSPQPPLGGAELVVGTTQWLQNPKLEKQQVK